MIFRHSRKVPAVCRSVFSSKICEKYQLISWNFSRQLAVLHQQSGYCQLSSVSVAPAFGTWRGLSRAYGVFVRSQHPIPRTCHAGIQLRTVSSVSQNDNQRQRQHNGSKQKGQHLNVDPFGTLKVTSPINVKISAASPQEYPQMDKLIYYAQSESLQNVHLGNEWVKNSPSGNEVIANVPKDVLASDKNSMNFQVPIKFGLHVVCEENANVHIEKVESDRVKISSDAGSCRLHNVKCGEIDIDKSSGEILSTKLLQGNVKLNLKSGEIMADRIQGQMVKVKNGKGDMSIKSLYGDRSEFNLENGNLSITNCHGSSSVNIENGDVNIGSLDGNTAVFIKNGNINLHIARHKDISLETQKGHISLSVDPELASQFEIAAKDILINVSEKQNMKIQNAGESEGLNIMKGYMNRETKRVIKIKASSVEISAQDWLSALKLT